MKKIGLLLLILGVVWNSYGQQDKGKLSVNERDVILVNEEMEGTKINVGPGGILTFEENDDTVQVKLGKRGIKIMETEDGTSIDIIDLDDQEDESPGRSWRKFRGHWMGMELGLNNFLTSDFSMDYSEEARFMELNTGKSWEVNLNFLQYSLGFGTDKVGLVTGLGVELNNYRFDNPLSIIKENGIIVADSSYLLDPDVSTIEKSKLHTSYLTMPLLLEFQIPTGRSGHRIHFSAGAIGGVKLWSTTKVIYKDQDGNKEKNKVKGNDYNLSPLRYGLTARIGYRALNLYASYTLTPLFEKNKGPELYPFSIGLSFHCFR